MNLLYVIAPPKKIIAPLAAEFWLQAWLVVLCIDYDEFDKQNYF